MPIVGRDNDISILSIQPALARYFWPLESCQIAVSLNSLLILGSGQIHGSGITYLIPRVRVEVLQNNGADRIVGAKRIYLCLSYLIGLDGPSLGLTGHPIVDQQACY